MAVHSKKAKDIDVYIESHKSCVKGKQKVEIKGKIEFLESFMLPLGLLQYNHENRRFNLEIQEYETQIGRKLDPSDKEDVKKIKELLLQDKIEAEKLYNDLKQLGEQREVAAITHDGIVVNGNRRMATVEELHSENPKKWEELWVVRLPEDILEKDLWKIEAGLQLSKEKVADYGPVNNLLMIKEGFRAGLTHKEIAASMYGWTDRQVAGDLERLDLIETFLHFMGGKNVGNYGLIKSFRLHEHFIDLQKELVEKLKNAGAPKKDLPKKLEVVFLYLRAHIENPSFNITHFDVRNICKILQDQNATDALTESFDNHNNINNVSIERLIDNLDKASDILNNRKYKERPEKLIDKAIFALQSINIEGNNFKRNADLITIVNSVSSSLKELKMELEISN